MSATKRVGFAVGAALALTLAACGSDDSSSDTTAAAATTVPSSTTAAAQTTAAATTDAPAGTAAGTAPPTSSAAAQPGVYDTPLASVCPSNIVVQTNWWPQADFGYLYQLIGPDGNIDKDNYIYSGPLGTTGVNLEVRAGGPARGNQQVSSLLYQDDSILLGTAGTDEAIQNSATNPVVAIYALYQRNPQILLWGNPDWDFTSVAEIGEADVPVLANSAAIWLNAYLLEGLLHDSQIDKSYKGSPARFVAEDGNVVQQGLVTSEPYLFEHLTPEWNKPVKYLVTGDSYPIYTQSLSIRPDKLESERDCLTALVPLLQRAAIDYLADPEPINTTIVSIRDQIQQGVYDAGLADYAVSTFTSERLIVNGVDGVDGSFDTSRVQALIDRLVPVYQSLDKAPKEG
jgi:hypothetical protein